MMALTPDVIWQRAIQDDEKHDAAHARLRGSLVEVQENVETLALALAETRSQLAVMKATPVDVAKLRFTPPTVAMILSCCITVAGGMWASTYSLRSDVRNILTNMELQTRLQDERNTRAEKSIDSLTRQVELLKYEQQRLREDVTKKGSSR